MYTQAVTSKQAGGIEWEYSLDMPANVRLRGVGQTICTISSYRNTWRAR